MLHQDDAPAGLHVGRDARKVLIRWSGTAVALLAAGVLIMTEKTGSTPCHGAAVCAVQDAATIGPRALAPTVRSTSRRRPGSRENWRVDGVSLSNYSTAGAFCGSFLPEPRPMLDGQNLAGTKG